MNNQQTPNNLNIRSSLEPQLSRIEYTTPKLEIHANFKQTMCGISTDLGLQNSPSNFEETLR